MPIEPNYFFDSFSPSTEKLVWSQTSQGNSKYSHKIMPNVLLILSTALVIAIAGYLLNQLPEIPNIPNKSWIVIRLFIYFSLLPVFFDLLSKNTGSRFRVVFYIAGFSLAAGVVIDGWALVKSWFHHYPYIESSLAPNLRERLLQEFRS